MPKLRYCKRYMSRSESASTLAVVPACRMQADEEPHRLESNGCVGSAATFVKVAVAGVDQSTWNAQSWSWSGEYPQAPSSISAK